MHNVLCNVQCPPLPPVSLSTRRSLFVWGKEPGTHCSLMCIIFANLVEFVFCANFSETNSIPGGWREPAGILSGTGRVKRCLQCMLSTVSSISYMLEKLLWQHSYASQHRFCAFKDAFVSWHTPFEFWSNIVQDMQSIGRLCTWANDVYQALSLFFSHTVKEGMASRPRHYHTFLSRQPTFFIV